MKRYIAGLLVALFCAAGLTPAASAGQNDWSDQLDAMLTAAEEYEVELSIAKRCSDAIYEVFYDKYPTAGPFLDVVARWARAMQRGQEGLAQIHHAVIIGRLEGVLDVVAEMQRRQITDRERYKFTREYVAECRARALRALADQ